MGWTGLYIKPVNIPEHFKKELESPFCKCIGQAFVGRFVLYGVWEMSQVGNKPYRFASITLIRYGNGKTDDCEFYYKDMDESVGPVECSMPKTLLKKLTTPALNAYARAWRKACWQNALGLTKRSIIIKIKRIKKSNPIGAIQLIEDWNYKHPENKIEFSYR